MWGRNYGHAGALEYWSRDYDLPPVCSSHNNYWLWGPPESTVEVLIFTGGSRESLEEFAEEVIEAGVAETPFAQESQLTIWVCRGLRRPIKEIWKEAKSFI